MLSYINALGFYTLRSALAIPSSCSSAVAPAHVKLMMTLTNPRRA
jgi:hypothetical protein